MNWPYAIALCIASFAAGQASVLVLGLAFQLLRDRQARALDLPEGVEVFRAWPPRSRNHTRETVQ